MTQDLPPEVRIKLAAQIKADIDNYALKEFAQNYRDHLGASIIAKDCWREIWYIFRWVKLQSFNGRMLRLFNRGHLEEHRFIQWLRGIGCTVWEVDPNTGKQFRIHGVEMHYGGSADSVGILPYVPNLPMLLEFKTHNKKSFEKLKTDGLLKSKPDHYGQMCCYGKEYQFKYGLYLATNKDDDEIWPEIVELNWNLADELLKKAQDIITAKIPPEKISLQSTYYKCKFCDFNGICHDNEPVAINCRSCKNAEPIKDGKWYCQHWQSEIPKEEIIKGCREHVSINV